MYPYTDGELNTFDLLQPLIQVSYSSKNSQTSPYCSVGVILMCLGIPKVHQQSIAQKLRNVSVKTLDDFRTSGLIGTYHVSVHFWVELGGEFRGVHQITEHHRELPSFRVG